jgi:phosphoesterase RecJ-like protein
MRVNEEQALDAARILQRAQRILLISHVRPDGDAIGSLIGFGLSLQSAGKEVQMISPDGVPNTFKFLPGSKLVNNRPEGFHDLVIVLDCSDLERTGHVLEEDIDPDLNIDHHITNLNFAKLNLVDTEAVATAEIIAEHLDRWGLPLTRESAANLLTGIITDTLGFRTANVTPVSMRTVVKLMETGVDLSELYNKALIRRSFEAVRFWGVGLNRLEREGPLVWTTLTLEDRRAVGYPGRDDADLTNVLSSIEEAAISVIFVEQPNGNVKVSWRADQDYDVSRIALNFGGGGHPAAAGAEIEGNIEEVRTLILEETRKLFDNDKVGAN